MDFTLDQVAWMIDLSAVRPDTTEADVHAMVRVARKYRCLCVTTLPSYTPLVKELLVEEPTIRVSGNVAFPSGGATLAIKVAEAQELLRMGCDELDMVKRELPDEIEEPMLFKFSSATAPIFFFSVNARESYPQLYQIADDIIGDTLRRIPGVGVGRAHGRGEEEKGEDGGLHEPLRQATTVQEKHQFCPFRAPRL